jgi:multidrug efflux pump
VATGFVVDDAIVVLENTSRHLEAGMNRVQAALLGAREVGFTVMSISISLVAVFIPLLFMGGQIGRLFREFAVTLSVAVLISLVISLTTTPMMCALLLKRPEPGNAGAGRLSRWCEAAFNTVLKTYERSLNWALAARPLVMLILLVIVGFNIYLFMSIPRGFFPAQDSGQLNGGLRADQSISFQSMQQKLRAFVDLIHKDPAVATVVGFTGGQRAGGGFLFVNLKPREQRKESGQQVIARLRPQLGQVTGASLFLNPVQDLRMGGRQSNSTYQYTLKSDSSALLRTWAARLAQEMQAEPALTDVDTDQEEHGVETFVDVDRASASRLGITARQIDNALYNSFGQRQVATIYAELNQYRVIMEVSPQYARTPAALNDVYVPTSQSNAAVNGSTTVSAQAATALINPALRDPSTGSPLSTKPTTMVPLSAIARFAERSTPTSVSHQDSELATTISFNLAEGYSLSDAADAIHHAEGQIRMPVTVRGSFEGTARSFEEQNTQQPLLIGAAILVIYIILGILYESTIHPVTVLSTLPSAGFGAFVALMLFKMEFSVIALIGVFLLIGIVKKNAILIIDFALEAERARGLSAVEAVREACLLRFRPILMTTAAAVLGALPLAIGFGEGSETRQPLGVAIIGGLIASQLLTLLTTPVVYVYLDKFRKRGANERALSRAHSGPTPAAV